MRKTHQKLCVVLKLGKDFRFPPPPPPPPPGFLDNRSVGKSLGDDIKVTDVISLPPDALVYLFPEMYARSVSVGGFKSPYSGVKVSHRSLYHAMVTASLAYMLYTGVGTARLVSVGRIFKHYEVEVSKLRRITGSQGLIAYVLNRKGIGESMRLIDMIGEVIGMNALEPDKVFIRRVYNKHVKGKVNVENVYEIARYRVDAEKLYSIWANLRANNQLLYNTAVKDAERAYKRYCEASGY